MSREEDNQKIAFALKEMRLSGSELGFEKETEPMYVREIRLPKEGGIYTVFEGMPPRKGFPINESVDAADHAKKAIMSILKTPMILLLPFCWKKFLREIAKIVAPHRLKPERYCTSVREVYRVIKNENLRDVACVVLEFDSAYRYRFQDAYNGSLFGMFLTLYNREKDKRLKKYWRLGLWVSPFLRLKLDVEKTRLDEDDLFHAKKKLKNYDWGGEEAKAKFETVTEYLVEDLEDNLENKWI